MLSRYIEVFLRLSFLIYRRWLTSCSPGLGSLRILECITTPPFVEIILSLPQSDKEDLHWLLPGFPCCDNVNDITFIRSYEDNPCAAVKLHSKNQLTVQTNPEAVVLYLPHLGAQFPHLTHIHFQNTLRNLPWHRSGQLFNLYNLDAITITGHLGTIQDTPTLIHLLEDRSSSGDVPCPKLARISIYTVGLNQGDVWLGPGLLMKQLSEDPCKAVQRNPDKNFEVRLAALSEEDQIPPLDIRWTRRW